MLQIAVMLAVIRLRHQHGDVAADHLVRAIAEQLLAGRVEQHHMTGLVEQDEPVDRRVDNRPEQEIGRAHVGTPVTNAHLVCSLLLEKENKECIHKVPSKYEIKDNNYEETYRQKL